jgi:pyruvate kinase
MDYQIIATLGPSSATAENWLQLLAAGASDFRLNTSHLDLGQLQGWLDRLSDFRTRSNSSFAVVLDLQGSKWRLGRFASFYLVAGQTVKLFLAGESEQPASLPVPHSDFFQAAETSQGEIILNDAKSKLHIESISFNQIRARVILGGEISSHKGITFRESTFRKETLSEKDQSILRQTSSLEWVEYAISYIRDAAEMHTYRNLLGEQARLAAKLERRAAVEEAAQIETADSLWLCRGDLGAELGLPGMAEAAWKFSGLVRKLSRPCFLAGQVLEHMTTHPTPTRAEVCGLYDALIAGYRGVVLSDETAVGKNPVLAVQTAAIFKNTQI